MIQTKKYPAYKDSGVEWLGEIPEHWKLSKIKYVVKEHSGCGFPLNRQGLDCNEVPFYKVSDINGNEKFVKSSNNYVDWDTIKREKWNIVPKHSIVAGKIGEALRKNHRKITLTDSIIDNNCIAIEATNIDYNFNYYLQLIIDFDWFSNPGAVPSMSILKYKNFIIPIPSPREQAAIANFLDDKTSKIDTAIAQKEQMIALLKERKQIIIQNAVTKGLDPNAKMKDSGVEWIGEIPEGWEVMPGLRFINENKERNIGMKRDTVLSLSYGNIRVRQKEELTGLVPESFETYQLVNKGDLIFRPTDLQNDKVSLRSSISYYEGIITSAYLNLKILNIASPKYYHYLFRTIDNNKVIYGLGSGLRQNISYQDFKRFDFPFPPLKEQVIIVDYLDNQSSKIDHAISLQQTQIEKLKEYKATLIDGAVTGKIKVTDE